MTFPVLSENDSAGELSGPALKMTRVSPGLPRSYRTSLTVPFGRVPSSARTPPRASCTINCSAPAILPGLPGGAVYIVPCPISTTAAITPRATTPTCFMRRFSRSTRSSRRARVSIVGSFMASPYQFSGPDLIAGRPSRGYLRHWPAVLRTKFLTSLSLSLSFR